MRITMVMVAVATVVGCGGSSENTSSSPTDGGPSGPVSPPPLGYDTEQANRIGCRFKAGDVIATTVGVATPAIPLKHVILLMMENRSFDHIFAGLTNPDADVQTNGSNLDPSQRDPVTNQVLPVFQKRKQTVCEASPNHEWGASHLQFNNGNMDGFVAASDPNGARAMEYYTEEDIPFYYWLAQTFAISARHFASLIGPTWPNRLFYIAATSCGYAEAVDTNEGIDTDCGVTARNLFNQLDDASVSFKIFISAEVLSLPSLADSMVFDVGAYDDPRAYSTIDEFRSQAGSNSLPEVAFIEPNYESYTSRFGGIPTDDHPPANIERGQLFVYQIIAALMSNPETWNSSALFITYDEHGGYYDHVVPPAACPPDPNSPEADYAFDRYGFRVPLIVVSPYARAGYISRYITDHTSILRFVQAWKNLGALTGRDANAWPLLDMFDFTQSPTPAPDISALQPVIDAAKEIVCPEK
jgi:phospholipase C